MTVRERPGAPKPRHPSIPMRVAGTLLSAQARRKEGKPVDLDRARAANDRVSNRLIRIPRGVQARDERLAGIPVVRYTAGGGAGTVMYIHGGAYVLGSARQGAAAVHLCLNGGPDVVSVEYRLAPEHPYPAALEDVMAVYRELLSTVGADNLVVAGESAGGGLLLMLLQSARAQGLPMPAGAAPTFPAADLSLSGASVTDNKGRDMLVCSEIEQEARWFVGERDLRDPAVSPVFGSFDGFPPTYLAVGARDILLDDSRRVAAALDAAGADVIVDIWPGTIHAFTALPMREGRQYRRRLRQFVAEVLTPTSDRRDDDEQRNS